MLSAYIPVIFSTMASLELTGAIFILLKLAWDAEWHGGSIHFIKVIKPVIDYGFQ